MRAESARTAQGAATETRATGGRRRRRMAGFAAACKAEVLKGRHAAPRKIALIAPLPFCILGVYSGEFPTYGWNYWYALMLPIAIALMTASIANIDLRQKLRTVLGLPLPPARAWWAKVAYALALVLVANLVVLAASVVAGLLGFNVPSPAAGLVTAMLLVVASAWMVPAGLALTVRFGTLAGMAVPAVLQGGLGVALWTSSSWFLVPPATALCAVAPLVGVAPSGVPLEAGDPLGVFGWECAAGLALAVALFAVLAVLGARWFAKREAL